MLDERIVERLTERLVTRIDLANEYVLKEIGKTIKMIGNLTPSDAYKLSQILKYGGSFDKIAQKIAEITNLNVKEIYKIFEEVAKQNYIFAKQFYDYRGVEYIPYEQNLALQNTVRALANMTANEYINISRTLGFTRKDNRGNIVFTDLSRTYQELIDTAVLSVKEGKDTFENQMHKTIKDLGHSGIKTINYSSGYRKRLDSAVRMNIKDGLRMLSNQLQEDFGKEFGADGVEISVHSNPAEDHADVQGRQFSKEQFENFQNGLTATDNKGHIYSPFVGKKNRRPISTMNCYHYIFSIILGVSKPLYSDKQLKEIQEANERGFDFEGKHYSNYEGTQLQRKLESEIRKEKDLQILANASDNEQLVIETQSKIRQLTFKYNQLSKKSKLPTKIERLKVEGYKKVNTSKFELERVTKAPNTILQNIENYGNINSVIPKGVILEDVHIIAGYGTNTPIKSINKLVKDYPEYKQVWQKKVGTVKSKYNNYEIHFYENEGRQYYTKVVKKKGKKNES